MDDLKKLKIYLPQKTKIKSFYDEIYDWPVEDGESLEE